MSLKGHRLGQLKKQPKRVRRTDRRHCAEGSGSMDMHSREQYLEALREEYRGASKKQRSDF